jgi:acyl-CoA thioester hydrolase
MTGRFTARFPVRHYELDVLNHLNNAVHVQYMHETAVQAAVHAGCGPDWCRAHRSRWVIRNLAIRYFAQVAHGDLVEVAVWVSRLHGVYGATLEYDLTLAGDGSHVARARAEWIHLDLFKNEPVPFPPGFVEAFPPTGAVEDLGIRIAKAWPTAEAHRYHSRRRVQFHELSAAGHVNHAVYLQWIGQAYFDALHTVGYPLERSRHEGWLVVQGGHDIDYYAPAHERDEIEVVSWVSEVARVRGAWTHEIYNAATGRLLARDYSLGIFVTLAGRPTTLPDPAIAAILRGPGNNPASPA